MSDAEQVLAGARVVTPAGVLDHGWVAVSGGRITGVGTGTPPAAATTDLGGAWLVPGFVDLHMHGGGGHNVGESPEAMAGAVAFHRRHGTTATLVSLVAAPVEQLAEQLGWIADLAANGRVLGAHLEGPFLAQARCGAQNPQHLLSPDTASLDRLITAARGSLRTITIAPELPGALQLIERAARAGIVVALGHSDATFEQGRAGIRAGATLATHLFNGMRPAHHREPGLVGAVLADTIAFELINDGVHIHPALPGILSADGRRPVLVTDAIEAAGSGDGDIELGGLAVEVRDGVARLRGNGSLAGSTLTMDAAFRRAVRESGLSMAAAALAAATYPAEVLGLGAQLGSIAVGRSADVVVLDDELKIVDVMASGAWIAD